jgi:hypothetical protein
MGHQIGVHPLPEDGVVRLLAGGERNREGEGPQDTEKRGAESWGHGSQIGRIGVFCEALG